MKQIEVKVSKWKRSQLSRHIQEQLEAMQQIEREFKYEPCNPYMT